MASYGINEYLLNKLRYSPFHQTRQSSLKIDLDSARKDTYFSPTELWTENFTYSLGDHVWNTNTDWRKRNCCQQGCHQPSISTVANTINTSYSPKSKQTQPNGLSGMVPSPRQPLNRSTGLLGGRLIGLIEDRADRDIQTPLLVKSNTAQTQTTLQLSHRFSKDMPCQIYLGDRTWMLKNSETIREAPHLEFQGYPLVLRVFYRCQDCMQAQESRKAPK